MAIAATLKAKRCDIYTDVPGIYTTDPNIVSKAYKLDTISYQEALEFARNASERDLVVVETVD